MAKIRLGCLEIRIETGRYARPRLPGEARICQICHNPEQAQESEFHFLFKCEAYTNERTAWLSCQEKPDNFLILSPNEKCNVVLNLDQNMKKTAYTLLIFMIREVKLLATCPVQIRIEILYTIFSLMINAQPVQY